jgi:hypothetical protein
MECNGEHMRVIKARIIGKPCFPSVSAHPTLTRSPLFCPARANFTLDLAWSQLPPFKPPETPAQLTQTRPCPGRACPSMLNPCSCASLRACQSDPPPLPKNLLDPAQILDPSVEHGCSSPNSPTIPGTFVQQPYSFEGTGCVQARPSQALVRAYLPWHRHHSRLGPHPCLCSTREHVRLCLNLWLGSSAPA